MQLEPVYDPVMLDDELRDALIRAMDRAGVSQADVARALGMQPPSVNKMVKGHTGLIKDYVQTWARLCGTEAVVTLLGRTPAERTLAMLLRMEPEERRLLLDVVAGLMLLPERDRGRVLGYVESMLEKHPDTR